MHMTQGPILEAGGMQVSVTAWCIRIVAGSTCKARVHDADVHGARDHGLVLCDQAFRSVRLRKTQAMDGDWEMARIPVDLAVGGFYQTFNLGDDLLETKALHLDVTGSKHFGLLQPYVGVGYDSFEMDLVYELTDGIETVDEISVDFEKETNLHGTVGLLANLPVVKAHIEFNLAAANTVALGLSFGN